MGRRGLTGRGSGRGVGYPVPLLPLLLACQLTEVTVAPGKRIVVVQSVISQTATQQFVVVEYSQTGETAGGATALLPPGAPKTPVPGAQVTIENRGSAACAGRVDILQESPVSPGVAASGIYAGSVCQPAPGDQLVLRVETPAGEIVTGSTTVPGAAAREVMWSTRPPGSASPSTFDRERDTVRIGVTPLSGRALQVEVRNAADLDDLAFFVFTDTMDLTIPGNLVNPFEGDDGQSVFRAGRYYVLAVALTDSNYYDFLRSRSDPFTGRGFINHLAGGIGVFGSVEIKRYQLRVVASVDDPREGRYRLTGTLDTVAVDATWELYLDDVDQFSAFLAGRWPEGSVDLSGDGRFLSAQEFVFRAGNSAPDPAIAYGPRVVLRGTRAPGGAPFPVEVGWLPTGGQASIVDTLTAQQISGPGIP